MSEGAVTETRRPADWALFALALAVSVAVVWMVSGEPLVVVGFAAGAILLGGIAWAAAGRTPPPVEPGLALPDWSVTVAAIDHGDAAIAVTDRAGRLTCANPLYERGSARAMPRRACRSMLPRSNACRAPRAPPGAMAKAGPIWSKAPERAPKSCAGKPLPSAPGGAKIFSSGGSARLLPPIRWANW